MAFDETKTATSKVPYTEWNDMITAFLGTNCVNVVCPGTVGTSEKTIHTFEFPYKVTVTRIYVNAEIAPGTGYNTTIKLTDFTTPKTVVLSGTNTTAQDEAVNQIYDKDTVMYVTVQDDSGSAVTQAVNIMIWFKPKS